MTDAEKQSEILPETLLCRNPEIIFTEIDGETVMMDTEFESYFGMADVATHIWAALEKEISFVALCEKLMDTFEVEKEQCQEEVLKFLEKLRDNDLLIVGGGSAGTE